MKPIILCEKTKIWELRRKKDKYIECKSHEHLNRIYETIKIQPLLKRYDCNRKN